MKLFKQYLFVLLFILVALLSRSQFALKPDCSITILSSESQIVSVASNKLITDITVAPIKFKSKINGFAFRFSTKEPYKQKGIIADSFLFKPITNSIVNMNHIIKDSVYYNIKGGLDY